MIIYRELKEEEIKQAVTFFHFLLDETECIDEQELLPTENNINILRVLIYGSYRIGIPCYCAEDEETNRIVAIMLTAKIDVFETKLKTVHSFGTYVLHKYRDKGIATKLLKHAFDELRNIGIQRVYGKFFKQRESSNKIIEELGMERLNFVICKTL